MKSVISRQSKDLLTEQSHKTRDHRHKRQRLWQLNPGFNPGKRDIIQYNPAVQREGGACELGW